MENSIKKFNNGNITIRFASTENNLNEIASFYDGEFFWNDLYINRINGYNYLVDFNTQLVYDCFSPYDMGNILQQLYDLIASNGGIIKIHPLTRKESKSLIEDLNNGY